MCIKKVGVALSLFSLFLGQFAFAQAFRPDPVYEDTPYSAGEQQKIYGGKHANPTARPLIELGRPLYREGPYAPAHAWLGRKNLLFPNMTAFGDWRTAAAANNNGKGVQGVVATRVNLELDANLTATERVHALIRPFDRNGVLTHWTFQENKETQALAFLDFQPQTLFFEGDAARMWEGASARENFASLPFAGGLIPLVIQNGIWLNAAFDGVAFTIPARSSRLLDISNMDLTFFAGFDNVKSAAVVDAAGTVDAHSAQIFGAAAFIEAGLGYWELDYGYTSAVAERRRTGQSYHNISAAFTRRYFNLISNSARVIWNFGQALPQGKRTADGFLLLLENSFATRKPYTLVPYVNLFAGFDRPQALARDAGGVLDNTGILFQTDNLTGFPTLDDTGRDTWGAAAGLEYLFSLNQQLVVEAAELNVINGLNRTPRPAKGSELGVEVRYQLPLNNAWLIRAEAMGAQRQFDSNINGLRLEVRRKF